MDTFGTVFRVHIFGESHGPVVGVVLDGVPAGLALEQCDFTGDLARRKGGTVGTTPRVEEDVPRIQSGVFNGHTTGDPVLIFFENQKADSRAYGPLKGIPRPGHADFTRQAKFSGFQDPRGGGQASGRLTVGLVAAGVVAKKMIFPMAVIAEVVEVFGQREGCAEIVSQVAGDSVGGVIECVALEVPVGLGEPFFDSVESLLAHAAFSLPGVRGVEFGAGFSSARMLGSACNDDILDCRGRTATNNAGGVNGGISNGNAIIWRIAVKPPSSIAKAGKSVDMTTGQPVEVSVFGRHDSCIALRVPVVMEAVTAIVLADLMARKKSNVLS